MRPSQCRVSESCTLCIVLGTADLGCGHGPSALAVRASRDCPLPEPQPPPLCARASPHVRTDSADVPPWSVWPTHCGFRANPSAPQVEAFVFGSVPLKTYLPDGDIDISLFAGAACEEASLRATWAPALLARLQRVTHTSASQLSVQDAQIIQAEVRC